MGSDRRDRCLTFGVLVMLMAWSCVPPGSGSGGGADAPGAGGATQPGAGGAVAPGAGGAMQPGGPGDPVASGVAGSLKRAHLAPAAVSVNALETVTLAGQAVEMASVQAGLGQVVTTGTLTQTAGGFLYSANPGDRLVVVFSNQRRIELFITALEGDLSQGSAGFFDGDHRFTVRVVVTDEMDAVFESVQQGGQRRIGIEGAITVEGVSYRIDAQAAGTTFFENDSTGSNFRSQTRTTGTITAEGFALDIDEGWSYEMVTTSGSRGGSASAATRQLGNVLRLGDETYTWEGVSVQFSYRDGKPSQLDTYWQAEGVVLRDGRVYGTYRKDAQDFGGDGGGYVKFVLDTSDGVIELESHQAF